ncbi:hypothetical protein MNBD_ALPHA09-398 [hydrothermal vent metagenome]|uniref:DUF1134 domain-containing protein n=1 Tax=hydrothermal vent metagenome TaxID=652676 RepID=A0A3B0TWV3_9ZZZZ
MKTFLRRLALATVVLAAAVWGTAQNSAFAQSATIQFTVVKAGYFLGVSGGEGTLFYNGRSYPLSIGGVSLGLTFGASRAEMVGEVYNLRHLSDIAGTYTELQAGVAIAGGAKTARLRNSKGVELHVRGRQIGLEVALDLGGIAISLK